MEHLLDSGKSGLFHVKRKRDTLFSIEWVQILYPARQVVKAFMAIFVDQRFLLIRSKGIHGHICRQELLVAKEGL